MTLQHAFPRCPAVSRAHHPWRPWRNPAHPPRGPTLLRNESILHTLLPSCGTLGSYRSRSPKQASASFPKLPSGLCIYISFRPERCPHHTEHNGERVLQDSNGRGHCYTYHSPFLPRSKQFFTLLHVFKVVLNYWYFFLLKFPGYVQAFKLFYTEVKVT